MFLLHRFARDIAPEGTESFDWSELFEVFDAPHEQNEASEYHPIKPFFILGQGGSVKYYVILPFYNR